MDLVQHAEGRRQSPWVLEARDIAVFPGLSGAERPLFQGLSLSLAPREVVDLIGPSGSGKTTLLRVLARMYPCAQGDLILDGVPSENFSPQHWRTHVSLLPQTAAFVEGTILDNILMPFRLTANAEVPRPTDDEMREMLDGVGLGDIDPTRSIDRLSVGQAARVALCRTLSVRPDVLLLDEVDAALDPESVEHIGALVARYVGQGLRACLRIRHRDPDAYTTRCLKLSEGSLSQEECHG